VNADTSVAVVTGSAHGLGEVIVRHLHSQGHEVAVVDIDGAAAHEVAISLDPEGTTARSYAIDVTDRGALDGLLGAVVEELGDVRILVNNAARTQARPVMEITADELESVLNVNFGGMFQASQVFGAHMAANGYGRIVNLGSLAAQNGGTATGGHYASSKGAILSATKVFARELAGKGVTVNAVSPGPLDSPMVRSLVGDDLESYLRVVPVGRLGDMGFIAQMISLLASLGAASVTGACWDANGGIYLR